MAKSKRQQQIRTAYSKLASGMRIRAKQLQQYYGQWLKPAKDVMNMARPLKQLGSDVTTKDLKRAMKQLERLRPEMYVRQIEKRLKVTIEQLQGAGYTGIDRSNILEFLDMMENTYYKALAKIYGSPEVAQQISQISGSRKPLTPEQLVLNMADWRKKIDEEGMKAKKLNLRHGYSRPKKSGSKNYG